MLEHDLDHRFAYHPPKTSTVAARHSDVRTAANAFAHFVNDVCPDGREKSLAVTAIEEAMMWANAAIARGQGPSKGETGAPFGRFDAATAEEACVQCGAAKTGPCRRTAANTPCPRR